MSDRADPSGTAAQPAAADNRSSFRAPIRLRVDYERMNTFFADYTKNISKGGTFIKTARPLPIGTRFVFQLSVPALSEPVSLSGEVAWTLPPEQAEAKGAEAGMGIRFIFADETARTSFEDLVEKMMVDSLGLEVTQRLLRG
jgi:type IV pilus assembly protein PilZ